MKTPLKRYSIRPTDAERVFEAHLASLAGQSRQTWHLNRRTIRTFLRATKHQNRSEGEQLHLDEPWLVRWMIWDSADRSPHYATHRLGVVGRYVRALTQAGVTDTDLMAEFRAATVDVVGSAWC